MEHRSKLSYWDRAELLERVKETYQKLHGSRPPVGLYDELEIKALEAELADIKGVELNPADVETNIVRFTIDAKLLKNLKLDYIKIAGKLREDHDILLNAGFRNDWLRIVTHRDVSRKHCESLVKALNTMLTP